MNVERQAKAPRRRGARYRNGDTLGTKYELERLVGEGSMGEVWLATNTALDLPVAIKLLRTKDAVDPDGHPTLSAALEEHLLHEAQATAKLSHPAIVRVFDFGLTNLGDPFIVMERLEGEDLRDRLTHGGAMSAEASVQLLLPVIHAMHTAHLRGIVHRDLKPENIFLAQDDGGRLSPKVVDFGIAELPWLTDVADFVIAGTPAYMAPEQAAGHPNADHRVDIWAVCVALYEMISGAPPFAGLDGAPGLAQSKDASGERVRDASAPPPVFDREAAPLGEDLGVDEELWIIVARGLAPVPAKRWRSMRELGEALAAWLYARGIEEDIRGISLKARWLYDSPAHRNIDRTLLTPTPLPIARMEGTSPTITEASDVAAKEALAEKSSDTQKKDDAPTAKSLDAKAPKPAADDAASIARANDARLDTSPGLRSSPPRSRRKPISRWFISAGMVVAASVGALALKITQEPPLTEAPRGVARSVELVLLKAERSIHPTPAKDPGKPGDSNAPGTAKPIAKDPPKAATEPVEKTDSPRHAHHQEETAATAPSVATAVASAPTVESAPAALPTATPAASAPSTYPDSL